MPRPFKRHTKQNLVQAYEGLRNLSDKEAIFFFDCCLHAVSELASEHGLTLHDSVGLSRLFNHFTFDEYISKTLFLTAIGKAGKWDYELKEPFSSFFLFEKGKGYTLSDAGHSGLSSWATSLRRVLQDREEFYRLKFLRWTPEAKAKRRAKQRFWQLPAGEQIQILREYYCLPFRTPEEKKIRRTKRIEIFNKYGLRNWDLLNAIRHHGDLVKSVRSLPEYLDLFPDYSSYKRSKS